MGVAEYLPTHARIERAGLGCLLQERLARCNGILCKLCILFIAWHVAFKLMQAFNDANADKSNLKSCQTNCGFIHKNVLVYPEPAWP